MSAAAWISIVAIAATLILAIMAAIYAAGKMAAILEIVRKDVNDIKADLKTYKESCFTKTEANEKIAESETQHKALWGKHDKIKKVILKLLIKTGFDVSEIDI